jgi:hypothetical protein
VEEDTCLFDERFFFLKQDAFSLFTFSAPSIQNLPFKAMIPTPKQWMILTVF